MIDLVFSSEISDVLLRAYVYCFRDKSPSVYRSNVYIFDSQRKTYAIGYFPEGMTSGENLIGIDRYWQSVPSANELRRFRKISVNDLTSLKWGCIVLKQYCRYRQTYLQKHWQSKIDRPLNEISYSVSMSHSLMEPIYGDVCLTLSSNIDFSGEVIHISRFRSYRELITFCCSNVKLHTNNIYIYDLLPRGLNCIFLGERLQYPVRKSIEEEPIVIEAIETNFLPVLPLYDNYAERNHYWISLVKLNVTDVFCKGVCEDLDLKTLQRISLE